MITECQEARNDNIYIDTIQTNAKLDSFEPTYGVTGSYVDSRGENIVDDACKYELNVVKVLLPSNALPLSWMVPRLTAGDTSADRFNKLIFDFSLEYKGVRYTQPVLWETQVSNLYTNPANVYPAVLPEQVDDRTFHKSFANYYALTNVGSLTTGFNKALRLLTQQLPVVKEYPCFTYDGNVGGWRLHCPPDFVYSSSNPTVEDIKLFTGKQLSIFFGRGFRYIYGFYSNTNPNFTSSQLNLDTDNKPDLKTFDVSDFTAPFDANVYTFYENYKQINSLRKWGGIHRIEIYSNIQLVKGRYNKGQDSKTGEFVTNESTQDSLLDVLYSDTDKLIEDSISFIGRGYPLWQSISNSGSLNKLSYTLYAVDTYGNRVKLRVPSGDSLSILLQLRKVID
tara:strand:- start:1079 stop:2263 length:1185 start_codon:yes stop_codon:yes gene_type:complete